MENTPYLFIEKGSITNFQNIAVIHYGSITVQENSYVNFGAGIGTENNNLGLSFAVYDSHMEAAALVIDGGFHFRVKRSSVDVNNYHYQGGGGNYSTYGCITENSVFKLSRMDDPVGWSGFTCVSTTSSFESANEIYCGSGNNPEKDK
ncbi:MAG: hypothetical protein LBV41_06020, partial [Cytophagaceae bacterium]|nr:hypothetical protein [Cytophagaceae bacterium]